VSEMVDRVAETLADKSGFVWDTLPEEHDIVCGHGMPEGNKGHWRRLARFAIETMREPTVDMVAAAFPCEKDEEFSHADKTLGAAVCLKLGGWDKIGIMGGEPIKQAAFLVRDYRLMIDAALPPAERSDVENTR
jgi:hypothetical protein